MEFFYLSIAISIPLHICTRRYLFVWVRLILRRLHAAAEVCPTLCRLGRSLLRLTARRPAITHNSRESSLELHLPEASKVPQHRISNVSPLGGVMMVFGMNLVLCTWPLRLRSGDWEFSIMRQTRLSLRGGLSYLVEPHSSRDPQ